MTKRQCDMTPEQIAHTKALALASRERNRARINATQQAKRAAAKEAKMALAPPNPSADELERIRLGKAAAVADYKRQWRLMNLDRIKAYRKAKYEANKESAIARAVEWNRANKEKRKAICARYTEANPEQRRAAKARRRARKNEAGGSFSKSDVAGLLKLQKGLCAVCRGKLTASYELDHRVPLARGGSNDRSNMQLLCMPCNRSKGAKDPIDFMQQRGYLL